MQMQGQQHFSRRAVSPETGLEIAFTKKRLSADFSDTGLIRLRMIGMRNDFDRGAFSRALRLKC